MLNTNRLLFVAILLCISLVATAQNTNSPYSRYGYGVLNDNGIGISKAMGGIAYGLRRNANINPSNPASYSKIDSLTFLFEIGLNYNKGWLSDKSGSVSKDNGGLDYIAMMLPVSKQLGFSFGILPYSSVGYKYGGIETINGVSYQRQFEGSGGFSQIYGGLAYAPIKRLSVGANVSYLYGSLDHTRSVPASSNLSNTYTSYRSFTLNTAKFDFGLQYELPIAKDKSLILGAVYSPKINSRGTYSGYGYESNVSTGSSVVTRIDSMADIRGNAGLPATYGVGFTYAYKQNWVVGADVKYEEWSKVQYDKVLGDNMDDVDRFNDKVKVSAGFEYVSNPLERNYIKRMRFRGGVNYSNSYLNVKTNEGEIGGYKQYGMTVGVGLPFRDMNFTGRTSFINVNLEYKLLNPEISNMVKEQYFGVSVSVNINDLWFMKSKFR